MQGSKQLTIRRLNKQQHQLKEEPIPGVLVARDGHLDFHFVIHGLDAEYEGGYYHGLLQLHESYPFAAPKLFFYTKNGRFELNMPICTSFTNYHQESWTSAWNVRSLLIATVSFMTSNQSSYGCRHDSPQVKRQYAKDSLNENFKNPKFVQLFREGLTKLGIRVPEIPYQQSNSRNNEEERGEEPINGELLLNEQNQRNQPERNTTRKKLLILIIAITASALTIYLVS